MSKTRIISKGSAWYERLCHRGAAEFLTTGESARDAVDVGMGHYMSCFDNAQMEDYSRCVSAYLAQKFE